MITICGNEEVLLSKRTLESSRVSKGIVDNIRIVIWKHMLSPATARIGAIRVLKAANIEVMQQ